MSGFTYRVWPKDSSTRFLPWTRDFIACHGWRSYLVEILWGAIIVYRVKTWRCELFGHQLGLTENYYEEYWLYESWRSCAHPHCMFSVQTYDANA